MRVHPGYVQTNAPIESACAAISCSFPADPPEGVSQYVGYCASKRQAGQYTLGAGQFLRGCPTKLNVLFTELYVNIWALSLSLSLAK